MAFTSSNPTGGLSRSFSIGPIKVQIVQIAAASGDTAGTVTFDKLSRVELCIVAADLGLTAQPTLSTNTATLAYTDPAATVAGVAIGLGV